MGNIEKRFGLLVFHAMGILSVGISHNGREQEEVYSTRVLAERLISRFINRDGEQKENGINVSQIFLQHFDV